MHSDRILKVVTVTGADDSVSVSEMIDIQKRFPFVEWGILLSAKHSYSPGQGANRFPSRAWLQKLVQIKSKSPGELTLSGHICGQWVREVLQNGSWPDFAAIDPACQRAFQRFQLNTHAEPHMIDYHLLDSVLWPLNTMGQSVIFQIDGVNNQTAEHARQRGHKNIAALFDLSHGAGVLPESWPKPIDGIACGYAGGLAPDNVQAQLESIGFEAALREIWIDAETHLRSNGDRVFDLNKVVAFLEAAAPWIKD